LGGIMNARLERKLRTLASAILVASAAGLAVSLAQGRTSATGLFVGLAYGFSMSFIVASLELFVLDGPMRGWLRGLSFTSNLMVRSAIYLAVIMFLQVLQDDVFGGLSGNGFWSTVIVAGGISVVINLGFGIANIVGGRALMNFITGRYHSPVSEDRFVLFVDIAGSTGLAEQLGGIAIHRLLDQIFRLLTQAVVDYRGDVLDYVGDEVIVTWPERDGAVDCRPLRCFLAMRDELTRAANQLQREFGVAPRIRGSLHFGPVIIGEIGDVKRAIVFNGDVMNTAARLEEYSRKVDGGFVVSRAAMDRFTTPPPFGVRNLGQIEIRGRADGIEVFGIGGSASPQSQGLSGNQVAINQGAT
jgi:adenylate cyclase